MFVIMVIVMVIVVVVVVGGVVGGGVIVMTRSVKSPLAIIMFGAVVVIDVFVVCCVWCVV